MLTAKALAEKIGGRLEGADVKLSALVETADCARDGALCLAVTRRAVDEIKNKKPHCVVLRQDLPELGCPRIITDKGKEVLIELLNIFYPQKVKPAVSDRAFIEPSARLGQDVTIYPLVYVGANVRIGGGTVLYPGAVVYAGCVIGRNCIIHAGAVIGADGFGYVRDKDGRQVKVPQKGIVIIEDDVEVGANTSIDRATLSATVIGRGTKIDNKVQIAHNVRIGRNCILAGSSNVAGSAVLGDNVIVAGNAGISDNITVGNGAVIFASTSVVADVPPNAKIYGTPTAGEYGIAMRRRALYNKLPEINERLKALEKKNS
ncbi:MAG: UDP-3-O-(3-hydroxymyristoyl)glucosamine N-acyltransferase [Candidatus Margulisbacteria bacterium]|jgi:UDP-3-O-[3-hydroxymyristoyl] glucosamine N-acyltransferase|nr:UDP-3-O-(3-hydroxymyristoyl)glucosamine N-acyltransferase [Candidatus Margulisiibacteriota bacterium]